jgi:surface polysaccharide O-acyltransferase-like enzyme
MFLRYIHNFRGAAILLVAAAHCVALFDWEGQRWAENLLRSVSQASTILFVFVAGFLFQYLSGRFEYRRYLKSKLQNVISPYFFCSIPILVTQMVLERGTFDPARGFDFPTLAHNIAWNYLTGYHLLPYWFVPMISVCYLLAPLLVWMDRAQYPYWLLPGLLLVTVLVHRPVNFTHVWHSCAYFIPIYIFGMWSSRNKDRIMPWIQEALWPLTLVAVALTLFEVFVLGRGGAIHSHRLFSPENGVVGTNAIQKIFMCWVVMGWLDRFDEVIGDRFDLLARLSFGVFFVHMYFVQAYTRLLPVGDYPIGGFLPYLLSSAIVIGLSVGSLLVAKKILGKWSKMVVGC